jgi:hypothetical protein
LRLKAGNTYDYTNPGLLGESKANKKSQEDFKKTSGIEFDL